MRLRHGLARWRKRRTEMIALPLGIALLLIRIWLKSIDPAHVIIRAIGGIVVTAGFCLLAFTRLAYRLSIPIPTLSLPTAWLPIGVELVGAALFLTVLALALSEVAGRLSGPCTQRRFLVGAQIGDDAANAGIGSGPPGRPRLRGP
jgi:hypothetical protein